MNKSIFGLISQNIGNSPYISLPSLYLQSYFQIKNSFFSNSFKTFLYSRDISHQSIHVDGTIFKNFLNHPIHLNSNIRHYNQTFRQTVTITNSGTSYISNCHFISCMSHEQGGALSVDSRESFLFLQNNLFFECSSKKKGGAIYILVQQFVNDYNCFYLCRAGTDNGSDGSAIYAEGNSNTSFCTTNECPRFGNMCWYGIFCIGYGFLQTQNVNISHCEVEFIAGLGHIRPPPQGSIVKFYINAHNNKGNSIGFADINYKGDHAYGIILNNSVTSGLFYLQNSTTTIQNFYFINNKAKLTYMSVGGKGFFEQCYFDIDPNDDEKGNGWGSAINCEFGIPELKYPDWDFLNTAFCGTDLHKNENHIHNKNLEKLYNKNQGKLMLMGGIFICMILLLSLFYRRRLFGKRIHGKSRNL